MQPTYVVGQPLSVGDLGESRIVPGAWFIAERLNGAGVWQCVIELGVTEIRGPIYKHPRDEFRQQSMPSLKKNAIVMWQNLK
jgi:hypothetical protein